MNTNALVLLAGGLASRMGSDKALYPVAGKPMIMHIITRLSGLSDEILVVIARNRPRSGYLEVLPHFVEVTNDELDGKSPLIGIVTGLRAIKSRYAVVLSCDIPFVRRDVIQLLLERASGADAAIPKSIEGRIEPLCAVYCRNSMLRSAEEALSNGHLSPTDAIHKLARVVYVAVEDEIRKIDPELRSFFNVNTKQDVARAEMIIREESSSRALRG
jgi:molybdopterin-guanine dinucleotide biosynthesis protein A